VGVVEGTVVGTDVVGESVAEAPAPRTLQLAKIMAGRISLVATDTLEAAATPCVVLAAKSAANPVTDDDHAALDTCTNLSRRAVSGGDP